MKTVVEGMLPASFLIQHAIYMQSCAHIENVTWEIIRAANNHAVVPHALAEKYVKMKLRTHELVKELEKAAKLCPLDLTIRLLAVVRRIREGQTNRNTAAHGAWFWDDDHHALRVEHYYKNHKDGQLYIIDETIRDSQVDEAVEEADSILRELIDIRSRLRAHKGLD